MGYVQQEVVYATFLFKTKITVIINQNCLVKVQLSSRLHV